MTVFIREVTTIDEDFHYLFGYAFIGLFTELNGAPGKKKEFVVSHIVTEHEPNETSEENPLIGISGMVYVR